VLTQTARRIARVCRAFILVVTVLGSFASGHAAGSTIAAHAAATHAAGSRRTTASTVARGLNAPNQWHDAERADT
jgi:hypothetical protein